MVMAQMRVTLHSTSVTRTTRPTRCLS
jgi:hypothetical protein